MKLVVGLGNPDKEYAHTRHNVGFMVIDKLTSDFQLQTSDNKKFLSEIAQHKMNDEEIIYVKPQTYMNNSGAAVRALMDFYKLTPTDIVVIHDEKDIPLGEYKIQANRSSAGHNGVQSIIDHVGTKNFTRIRVGVGPENKKINYIEEFVMGRFPKEEKKKLEEVIKQVIEEINKLVK